MERIASGASVKTNSAVAEKYPQSATIVIEQPSAGQHQSKAIDVYDQQIEPICNYRMVIVVNPNAAIPSIMLQEYHYCFTAGIDSERQQLAAGINI